VSDNPYVGVEGHVPSAWYLEALAERDRYRREWLRLRDFERDARALIERVARDPGEDGAAARDFLERWP
jgi:serine/threonine protein kinase HipA of HipAB toxin-antitoxin module